MRKIKKHHCPQHHCPLCHLANGKEVVLLWDDHDEVYYCPLHDKHEWKKPPSP